MLNLSPEVASALYNKKPVVALESTIISHGLPRPRNLQVAQEVEEIVRETGAIPATIAIIDGQIQVGLNDEQLHRIANDDSVIKASIRDLGVAQVKKLSAATTVAATAHIAGLAGIPLFATGGLGGVHRGDDYDESADLIALAQTKIVIVCAGVKSILHVPATLERLETLSIPVLGYQTHRFPGFYLRDSGYALEHRVESPAEIAAIYLAGQEVKSHSSIVVANPAPSELARDFHDQLLVAGLNAAHENQITGKAVTPFLLEFFHRESKGASLDVNVEIIQSNAKLAAQIAISLA